MRGSSMQRQESQGAIETAVATRPPCVFWPDNQKGIRSLYLFDLNSEKIRRIENDELYNGYGVAELFKKSLILFTDDAFVKYDNFEDPEKTV